MVRPVEPASLWELDFSFCQAGPLLQQELLKSSGVPLCSSCLCALKKRLQGLFGHNRRPLKPLPSVRPCKLYRI